MVVGVASHKNKKPYSSRRYSNGKYRPTFTKSHSKQKLSEASVGHIASESALQTAGPSSAWRRVFDTKTAKLRERCLQLCSYQQQQRAGIRG